jgi:hypothetical protein
VRLNRWLWADVYLGIVEVLERDGTHRPSRPGAAPNRQCRCGGCRPAAYCPHCRRGGEADALLMRRIACRLADCGILQDRRADSCRRGYRLMQLAVLALAADGPRTRDELDRTISSDR